MTIVEINDWTAGLAVSGRRDGDRYCASCGYGVSRWQRAGACPMCHSWAWRRVDATPGRHGGIDDDAAGSDVVD